MQLGATLLSLLHAYEFPVLFFGGFFLGETVAIPASFLAGEGLLSLQSVFWVMYLGTISADTLWFFVGPSFFKFAHRFRWIATRSEAVLKKLDGLYSNRPFRALVVSKFVFGTRFLTAVYLSTQKLSGIRFFLVNLASTFVWLALIVAIGWLAGKSIINLLPIVADIKYALLVVILLVVLMEVGPKWLTRRFGRGRIGDSTPR
ncbi:MAG: hypothetical protein Q7R64_01500 [bacterium]|nr:hypothetical protein [bacterium]